MPPYARNILKMSLNRYEQIIFNYWQTQPDELQFWKTKVVAASRMVAAPGETARDLERELWDYFAERSQHVALFKELNIDGVRRISLLNLAEYVLRLWGPPPKPRKLSSNPLS
ncbi:MAG TPA: hypothetical protein VGM64_11455 [Lacunisphaera sp.]|jgi:hypothetical protein